VPLVVGGVSPAVGELLRTAAARAGRILYVSPGAPPAAAFPPQILRPGASVAVGESTGDIQSAGVGTVAYTDANNVWAFGHAVDSAGRRSLFLEDAYVYAVASNPLTIQGSMPSYKIAAPGHDLGTFSNDALNAAVGQIGALPPHFPLQVVARGVDSGAQLTLNSSVADESAIGMPTGISALTLVGPAAVAQAATAILNGAPPQQSGSMCFSLTLQESKTPLGFCNNYVEDDTADAIGLGAQDNSLAPYMADLASAIRAIDSFKLGVLHVTSAKVTLALAHGVSQGYMVAARGPLNTVHPGGVAKIAVLVQVVRGGRTARVISVRIPRTAHRGKYAIRLSGTPSDSAGSGSVGALVSLLTGTGGGGSNARGGDAGPPSVVALAHVIAAIHRFDGVRAKFIRGGGATVAAAAGNARRKASSPTAPPRNGRGGGGVPVYRDPALRLSGTVVAAVKIS
jgi:hypothetical protein